ncbi:MAG: GTP-binding protein, partial [Alphaproteobacteria bacterium]|nr:GTP-binding protein [Alphaproteobacteria bacterium]
GFKQDHENEVAELFEDQLLSADMVVINKCDLLRAADIDAISRDLTSGKIEGLRPAAKILTASHGQVSPALLLGIDQSVEDDLDNRKSHHDDEGEEEHGHDEFHSFVATFGAVADEKKLENVIDQLIKEHAVLRMKGLVARVGKPHKEIWQVVGPRIEHYFTTAPHNHDDSQLVVIGLKGLDEAAIKEQLLAAAA